MKAEDLYRTLQKDPFQPLRLRLKDGRALDVPCRELAVVGVDFVDIGIQAKNQPQGVWATGTTVPMRDISSVEPLEPVAHS